MPAWADAKWMYDRAVQLNIPFMAGSPMPVGFRVGQIALPMECELESAVGIGYSGLDIYGSHAMEFYRYHVERRRGAENGVMSVQYLSGTEIWAAVDSGRVSREAFEAAFTIVPKQGQPDPRQDENANLFLFEYGDGLTGAVFMLGCVSGTGIGLKLKGQRQLGDGIRRTERTAVSALRVSAQGDRADGAYGPTNLPGRTHTAYQRYSGCGAPFPSPRWQTDHNASLGDFLSTGRSSACRTGRLAVTNCPAIVELLHRDGTVLLPSCATNNFENTVNR